MGSLQKEAGFKYVFSLSSSAYSLAIGLDCGMKIEETLDYADLEIDGEFPFAKIPPPHKGFSLVVAENSKTPTKISRLVTL